MTTRLYSRRSFIKTLSVTALGAPFITSGLRGQSPNSQLRHASFGASGMAWSDITELTKLKEVRLVAVAEVDETKTGDLRKKFPEAKIYKDWRQLIDKEHKNLDSVNVSTPDHMHAPIGMTALQAGLNVYGQKPLAHDIFEVRRLTEAARNLKRVTQMGIQIQSNTHYRLAVKLVRDGVIGKIKEVHSWVPKSWGDTSPRPDRNDPVPAGFDWDLWLGVCQSRPFLGDGYYHPANWRKRLDFGTGTFGDMGCHIFDPVFKALDLDAPISVRSEGAAPNQWNWAVNSQINFVFPGTLFSAGETLPVAWYDGESKPGPQTLALLEGDQRPEAGSIFVGTEGTMVLPHWSRPLLYPDAKFKDFKFPAVPGGDHWGQFAKACMGEGETTAHWGYAGPLTEAVLLGGIASRFPKTTLKWDPKRLKLDLADATQFIRRTYRNGWKVRGLS